MSLDVAVAALRAAFPEPWLLHYSLKANDVPAIVRLIHERGFGANVVSLGEWRIARRAGVPNEATTLEGIGKTDADLRAAVRAAREGRPLRWLSIESVDEAGVLGGFAARARLAEPPDVLFRLNPDVSPETHRGLAVGAGASKFGLTETEVGQAIDAVGRLVRPRGIHVHVGSQLGAVNAWRDAVRRALAVVALLRGSIPTFDTLDVGGGFPVGVFGGDPVPSPARFAAELPALLEAIPADRRPTRLAIEPGRFLVARAGFIVARVLHVRERGGRQVVIDAGMSELIRPALYGARHPIAALTSLGREVAGELSAEAAPTMVEGPICESTDSLGEHLLPPLRRGDFVAIRDAGAYAASMSSRYNGRPPRRQVVIDT